MPTFAYTARDSHGAPCNGTMAGDSVAAVTKQLRAEGKYPTSVREAAGQGSGASSSGSQGNASAPGAVPMGAAGAGFGGSIRLRRADLIQIATQLGVMIDTGVTISEALNCIAAQAEKPNVKAIVEDLSRQVQGGSDFSSALSKHPKAFPRLFVALIRAAERSGQLGKLLQRATGYLRDEHETIRRVRGALTYPGFMMAFAVTTTVFLLAFVLPKFTAIYASKAAALPLPTKALMAASEFLVTHYVALPVGLVVTVAALIAYVRTAGGRRAWHYLQLRIPLLGPMFRKLHLARGLRMVGTMAAAGVNLVDCVNTARDLCGNTYFVDLWDDVRDQLQVGRQLSEPLFASPLVPKSVAAMISSAEKGGKLAGVLEQVSTYAEAELKEKIADVTRYIEPIMIIVMGGIIGGVSMALLLPIFSMSKVMAQ